VEQGHLESGDFAYVHLEDSQLAQAVLDTLWAATKGDPRVFAGATNCAFCGRQLTDALSSARGYGPDCAEKYGMPRLQPAGSIETCAA
jgi:hypothetical protein